MFKVGDKVVITATVTDEMVRQFAEVSGDKNPMHLDDAYAATTRFKKRIAHGMISAALISRALGGHLGPGGIYLSQSLKFLNPVFIDDELSIELEVKSLRPERGIGNIETIVRKVSNGDIVVKGEAIIMAAGNV
jgi:3-hydroxybutyryl-CoA dehydratase